MYRDQWLAARLTSCSALSPPTMLYQIKCIILNNYAIGVQPPPRILRLNHQPGLIMYPIGRIEAYIYSVDDDDVFDIRGER